jgi:DinB superfamily
MDASAPEIKDLKDQLDAAERDARALVAGLGEERGGWRAETGSWSVAECLDHLASANRVYLHAMKEPAIRAREQGRFRRGQVAPGFVGRWFVKTMEPPVKAPFRMKAPRIIEPRAGPPIADVCASFRTSQDEVRAFLRACADLDLAAVRFPNPFVRGIRFSLATGLHVITAHERRHLWQAWRVRRAAEGAAAKLSRGEDSKTKAELM